MALLEMNCQWPCVKDGEGQLTVEAWIDVKPRDVDQSTELGLGANRNEGKGVTWDDDSLFGN